MLLIFTSFLLFLQIYISFAFTIRQNDNDDKYMHAYTHLDRNKRSIVSDRAIVENTAEFWEANGQSLLEQTLAKRPIEGKAKNVILFLGDGMSIPTLGAARVYQGQKQGHTGEEWKLSFEKFPYIGLSKTYCADRQVADSACSSTAYLSGVKANLGTLGVTTNVKRKDCLSMMNTTNHLDSIARWAQLAGKSTGIVTTTRVTHASPGGIYSHTAERDWECDTDVRKDGLDPMDCPDIAAQLIYGDAGMNLNVIFGGGRQNFLPKTTIDDELTFGKRSDGINLINEWKLMKHVRGKSAKYIWNREQLLSNISQYDYVLGLFEDDHCPYNLDANHTTEPTIAEMTAAAIEVLEKNKNGYFLFVEGGRIDHGHHDSNARKALDETVQFSDAVDVALGMTNPNDTLIIVTSDHAHTMSYSGYPVRGNDILGIAGVSDIDKLPYTTLSYANGPGYKQPSGRGIRYDVSQDLMASKDYKFPSTSPLKSETHGGDDVGIFALGPWAHLLVGVHEQHLIPRVMAFSSCIGKGLTACDNSDL